MGHGCSSPRIIGGAIAVVALVALGVSALPADAATFTVTTTADVVDNGDSVLSLREAVDGANASAADDLIELGPGVHTLTIAHLGGNNLGGNNNDNTTGDLDPTHTGQLTIRGAGRDVTYIDADGLSDRILDMRAGALVLEDLTIRNGDGTITCTPNAGWWGVDLFTYQLCGPGESSCNTAVVTVTVTAPPTTTTTTTTTTVPPTTTTVAPTTIPTQAKPDSVARQTATPPASLPATGPTHAGRISTMALALILAGLAVVLVGRGARP